MVALPGAACPRESALGSPHRAGNGYREWSLFDLYSVAIAAAIRNIVAIHAAQLQAQWSHMNAAQ